MDGVRESALANALKKRMPQDAGGDPQSSLDSVYGKSDMDPKDSMMKKYVTDMKDALGALKDGDTKKAASILDACIRGSEEGDHPTIEHEEQKMPA